MHTITKARLSTDPAVPEVRGMTWITEGEFALLRQAARHIGAGQHESAAALLEQLPRQASSEDGPERRLLAVFARALGERCSAANTARLGNLYMDQADVGSMIRAYQVLVAHTPFIRFAYAAANHSLLALCQTQAHVHVVDIGMGAGSQWLDFLARHSPGSAQLRITGIDVPDDSANGADALHAAGERLHSAARARGMEIDFRAIPARIETLGLDALRDESAPLFLNALLALHHTPSSDGVSDPLQGRRALLRRLRNLRPVGMVMVEPDAEHDALGFVERVDEALRHYSTVFGALDALLPRDLSERHTIENHFFGREVMNIVVGEGAGRVERHQRRDAWAGMLAREGFVAQPLPVSTAELAEELALTSDFSITEDAGMHVLRFRGSPLLAASAWGCASTEATRAG